MLLSRSVVFIRVRRPLIFTRTDTLFPSTTLFRAPVAQPMSYLFRAAENLMRDRHRADQARARREQDWKLDNFRFRRSEEHTSELQSLMRSQYAVFCLQKKTIA